MNIDLIEELAENIKGIDTLTEWQRAKIAIAADLMLKLADELKECQDQRRAAFRRIEELDRELDAMRAQIVQGETKGWVLREVYFDEDGNPSMHRAPTPQASMVWQEPVAWMVMNGACSYQLCGSEKSAIHLRDEMQKRHDLSGSLAAFHVRPLVYGDTNPAQQAKPKPLTRENAMRIVEQNPDAMKAIRLTEAAHGITNRSALDPAVRHGAEA